MQRVFIHVFVLPCDVRQAVRDAERHVAAVREDETDRAKEVRQLIRQHQERHREDGHVIVVSVDLFTRVGGKHVAFGDAVDSEKNNRKCMPSQQQLWKSTSHKILPSIQEQQSSRVRLSKDESNQSDRRDAFAHISQHLTRLFHLLLALIFQLNVARDGLREIEKAAVFDGSKDKASRETSHVVNDIISCLLAKAEHWTH